MPALRPLTPKDLAAWAAYEPFPPYGFYSDFDDEKCRLYRARQLESLAGRPDHHAWLWSGPDGAEVAVGITRLGWDTEQFGTPAGRLDYLIVRPEGGRDGRRGFWRAGRRRPDLAEDRRTLALATAAARAALAESDGMGIRHLSARVNSREVPVVQAVEAAGGQLVNAILRFSLDGPDFSGAGPMPPGVALREAGEADIEPLARLAQEGFTYDRFHNDPLLEPGVADRVHGAWLANAVRGRTGSGVVMAEVDGRPAGFFILSIDREAGEFIGTTVGTLVLITVDGTLRRRGVALALSLGSVEWLRDHGATRFEVGTQLANVPAANVYLKAGFRLVQTSVSLRRIVS